MGVREPGKPALQIPHWIREVASIVRVVVLVAVATRVILYAMYWLRLHWFQLPPKPLFPGPPLPTVNPDGA
jgi:hypothetical protein